MDQCAFYQWPVGSNEEIVLVHLNLNGFMRFFQWPVSSNAEIVLVRLNLNDS